MVGGARRPCLWAGGRLLPLLRVAQCLALGQGPAAASRHGATLVSSPSLNARVPPSPLLGPQVWVMAAQFEIRQLRLDAARKIMGMAIGMCPKVEPPTTAPRVERAAADARG